jgi:ABC transporter substrate binding protein
MKRSWATLGDRGDRCALDKKCGNGVLLGVIELYETVEARSFQHGLHLSYGPNIDDVYRQLAGCAAKLLHGTPPRDLPVEQPTSFELVINQRTADDIGLSVPENLEIQATKVIK